jgi:CrcB protein
VKRRISVAQIRRQGQNSGEFMLAYLWVAIGGALGSVMRFGLNGLISARFGETFPWGTLVINVTGSFLIGIFAAFSDPDGRALISPGARQFLMVGICGGYTTFSSFSLQTLRLAQDGEWLYAGGNVILSVVLCLVAVWLGYLLGSMFNSAK